MTGRSAAILTFFLTLLLTVSVTGCGARATKVGRADKAAKSKKVETPAGGARVELKNSESELVIDAKSAKLPNGWPSDMPVFPEAKVTSAVSGTGDANMTMAVLRSRSAVAGIKEFYEKNLPESGWVIDNLLETSRTIVITASKEERAASLSISEDTDFGESIISINLIPKP